MIIIDMERSIPYYCNTFLQAIMNTYQKEEALLKQYTLPMSVWEASLEKLLDDFPVYAPVKQWQNLDYALLSAENILEIQYNRPKPVSPLKLFLLPVKENVVLASDAEREFIVIGAPACDLWALDLLDLFYLDSEYVDPYYKLRREKMIIIGTDCHSVLEHCHCTSYGLNPYPGKNQDITLNILEGKIYLEVHSLKGDMLIEKLAVIAGREMEQTEIPASIHLRRQEVKEFLDQRNKRLPNYQETTNIVRNADESVWQHYAKTCVSCGACATICPTCTCFLLIDRPGFEKVKQMDACQYPGFQKVAGGEDPHGKLSLRFRNRYMCKYVFRPERYDALACTGCGRCIEACIGTINKNELFIEITQ